MNHNCHVVPIEKIISPDERENSDELILLVKGMGCANCAMRVRNALFALRGVLTVEVSHYTAVANVTFNPDLITIADLLEAVSKAGNDGRHSYRVVSVIIPQPAGSLSMTDQARSSLEDTSSSH